MEYISKLCQTDQMRSKHFGFSTIVNHNNGKAVIWLCKMQLPHSNIKTTNVRSQLLACNTSEATKAPGMNGSASVLQRSLGHSHLFEQIMCQFSFILTCFFSDSPGGCHEDKQCCRVRQEAEQFSGLKVERTKVNTAQFPNWAAHDFKTQIMESLTEKPLKAMLKPSNVLEAWECRVFKCPNCFQCLNIEIHLRHFSASAPNWIGWMSQNCGADASNVPPAVCHRSVSNYGVKNYIKGILVLNTLTLQYLKGKSKWRSCFNW